MRTTRRRNGRHNGMKRERYLYPGKVLEVEERNGILTFKIIKENERDIDGETAADDSDARS